MADIGDFNAIRISLASPEQIRAWSFGEVKSPDTMNYRTLRPQKDGLFCERIFGPAKDWVCSCGKYHGHESKGIVCDKCGVLVGRSDVRRERFGHVELAAPVCHTWYANGVPSHLGVLLDLSPRKLAGIIYYTRYVVTFVDEAARAVLLARQLRVSPRARGEGGAERSAIEEKRERELAAARREESATLDQLRRAMGGTQRRTSSSRRRARRL